jgi:arylsulfatase A-like enzyme
MTTDRPNVLIIILDSARARNTSLHGYHRETTPFLEQFSAEATVYTESRAPAGRSLQSHASIFTGYLPQEHGISNLDTKLAPGVSIFEWLSDMGYATGLFTDNPYVADLDTGLSNGFDRVVNNKDPFDEGASPSAFVEEEGAGNLAFLSHALRSDAPVKSVLNGLAWTLKWRFPRLAPGRAVFSPGFTYADQFTEWRRSVDAEAWAGCINLMDTHVPFRPQERYDRWTTDDAERARKRVDMEHVDDTELWKHVIQESRYDGTIRQADAVVEQIIKSLRKDGELSDTLVVVTADHGEGFGERSPVDGTPSIGHGDAVDEPLLHVPLVVHRPEQVEESVVSDPVGLVDLPTAIKRAVDGGHSGPLFATNREVYAGGNEDGDRVDAAYESHEYGVLKYLRGPESDWTIHHPTPSSAYVLDDTIPDSVADAMSRLDRESVAETTDSGVSDTARQQLTALGYAE